MDGNETEERRNFDRKALERLRELEAEAERLKAEIKSLRKAISAGQTERADTWAALCHAIRRKRGITQRQLADLCGCSFATINAIENMRARPTGKLAEAIERLAKEAAE